MSIQSSRLFFAGNDHKDIYFRGKYHDAMYIGSRLVWQKLPGITGSLNASISGVTYHNGQFYLAFGTSIGVASDIFSDFSIVKCSGGYLTNCEEGLITSSYGNVALYRDYILANQTSITSLSKWVQPVTSTIFVNGGTVLGPDQCFAARHQSATHKILLYLSDYNKNITAQAPESVLTLYNSRTSVYPFKIGDKFCAIASTSQNYYDAGGNISKSSAFLCTTTDFRSIDEPVLDLLYLNDLPIIQAEDNDLYSFFDVTRITTTDDMAYICLNVQFCFKGQSKRMPVLATYNGTDFAIYPYNDAGYFRVVKYIGGIFVAIFMWDSGGSNQVFLGKSPDSMKPVSISAFDYIVSDEKKVYLFQKNRTVYVVDPETLNFTQHTIRIYGG